MASRKRKAANSTNKKLAILMISTQVDPADAVEVYTLDITVPALAKECAKLKDALATHNYNGNYSKGKNDFEVSETNVIWMPSKPFNKQFPLIGSFMDTMWKHGPSGFEFKAGVSTPELYEGGVTELVMQGGADFCFSFANW